MVLVSISLVFFQTQDGGTSGAHTRGGGGGRGNIPRPPRRRLQASADLSCPHPCWPPPRLPHDRLSREGWPQAGQVADHPPGRHQALWLLLRTGRDEAITGAQPPTAAMKCCSRGCDGWQRLAHIASLERECWCLLTANRRPGDPRAASPATVQVEGHGVAFTTPQNCTTCRACRVTHSSGSLLTHNVTFFLHPIKKNPEGWQPSWPFRLLTMFV